jgi:hypothetical protein
MAACGGMEGSDWPGDPASARPTRRGPVRSGRLGGLGGGLALAGRDLTWGLL